ncbi:type VII secretion target [Streptomyces qinglanensis]|uniref:Excreted virulence factor EspC, type VII ESX diderm n=1 Tax=Streptomyces qinglanensis TaxID=943816 RepID=A0A1H9Q1G2_9ACTN|nr:type VII secretion target [Streptomyces qinglanensis]SER54232.1 Excreted virulence factor EspC, type VII ESX diderm [Streptomyces qinglanensis]
MNFAEEWSRLKTDAQERKPRDNAAMQLAGYNTEAHGRGTKLHITSKLLRKRAGDAEEVAKSFGKADNKAIKETGEVKSGLSGFKSAGAFATFEQRWEGQVRHVKWMLRDGLADALRNAASTFDTTDHKRKQDMDKLGAKAHQN